MTQRPKISHAATYTQDTRPALMTVTPTSVTGVPTSTRQLTPVITSIGGYILTGVTPTSWTSNNPSGVSVNSTGLVTFNVLGQSAGIQAHYVDSGLGINISSNVVNATCSQFAGPSATALSIMDGLRSGLYDSLAVVGQIVPGTTVLTEDPVAQVGTGWAPAGLAQGTLVVVDDTAPPDAGGRTATYGKIVRLIWPQAPRLAIDHIVKGSVTTEIHLMAGLDAHDFMSSFHWDHNGYDNTPTGKRHYNVKNLSGDGGTIMPGGGATGTIISNTQVNLDFDSTSWPTPAAGQAKLTLYAGYGSASINQQPDWTRPSLFGDFEYEYYRMRDSASNNSIGYSSNDGAGGQKQIEHWFAGADGTAAIGFMNTPSTGFATPPGAPGDDLGPISLGGFMYGLDRWQGSAYGDPTNPVGTPRGMGAVVQPVTRNLWYDMELLHFHGDIDGDDSHQWMVVNGVLAGVASTNAAQDYPITFRVLDPLYGPIAFRAWMLSFGNVWGGGGSIQDQVDNYNDYAEVFHARGWVNAPAGVGISLVATSEGGASVPNAPFNTIFELRDGLNRRIKVPTQYNGILGSQQLEYSATGGSTVTTIAPAGQFGGNYAGYNYAFEAATGTPPSAGSLRANNASLMSITHLYFTKLDLSSNDGSPIAALTTSSTQLLITRASDGLTSLFDVTSITLVGGTYYDVVVTPHAGGTLPTNGENCSIKMQLIGGAAGRIRLQTMPGSGGINVTTNCKVKQFGNNDKYTGVDYVGAVTVAVGP